MSEEFDLKKAHQENSKSKTAVSHQNQEVPPTQGTKFLEDLSLHEIAKEFTEFGQQGRHTIVPIGFPQAGKSLLLSSLMYYARKGKETLFKVNLENDFPFNNGRKTVDNMIKAFDEKRLFGANAKGSLDLIGIDIVPTKPKLPTLKLAFLDLAGEDIKNIKTSEESAFTEKINAVFNGLQVVKSPIIFSLITPFEPAKKDGETSQDAHNREDALHYDFLNYIEKNQPNLKRQCKFFIIVSQWDKNPNENQSIEEYIRTKRPSIYAYVKNSQVVWGQYSVGLLLESKEDGINYQSIVRINHDYPSRFWKKLYQICTGKNLDQKTFLQKIFG
jgi:hypothetical protein